MDSLLHQELSRMMNKLGEDVRCLLERHMAPGVSINWGEVQSRAGKVKIQCHVKSRWMDTNSRKLAIQNRSRGDEHYDIKVVIRLCEKTGSQDTAIYQPWDPFGKNPDVILVEISTAPVSHRAKMAAKQFDRGYVIKDFPLTDGKQVLEAIETLINEIFGGIFLVEMIEASSS